jgi:hypothetical protein
VELNTGILGLIKFLLSLGAGGMLGAAVSGLLYLVPAVIFSLYLPDSTVLFYFMTLGGLFGKSVVEFSVTNNPKARLKESRINNTILLEKSRTNNTVRAESFLTELETKVKGLQFLEDSGRNLPEEEKNKIMIEAFKTYSPSDNLTNINSNQLPESRENKSLPSSDQSEE